jgi:hypothetical protein
MCSSRVTKVWVEFGINSDSTDGVDWKRPRHADIYEGEFKFEKELATSY